MPRSASVDRFELAYDHPSARGRPSCCCTAAGSWHDYAEVGARLQAEADLIVSDLRASATPTAHPCEPQAAIAWLWKFVDGATTPGERYCRAMVVIAAEQYATRLVLPSSRRRHRTSWS